MDMSKEAVKRRMNDVREIRNEYGTGKTFPEAEKEARQWEEYETILRRKEARLFKKFNDIKSYSAMDPVNGFKEEAEALVKEINSLSGSLYSEEGKKEHAIAGIEELADRYKSKNEESLQRVKRDSEKLIDTITKKLHGEKEVGSEFSIQEKIMRDNQHEAEVKNKLYMATDTKDVESTFNELVEHVKLTGNKNFGRYLLNHSFLFMERCEQLGGEGKEKLIQVIKANKEKLEDMVLSDREKALSAMSKRLEGKKHLSPAVANRSIDHILKSYTKTLS